MIKKIIIMLLFLTTFLNAASLGQAILTQNYNPSSTDIAINESGEILIAFESNINAAKEIYFVKSTDNGSTWSTPILISDNDGIESSYPKISTINNKVFITWQDKKYGNIYEIFLRRIINGILDADIIPISYNTSSDSMPSFHPDIAILNYETNADNNDIVIVWQDMRNSNSEIYYKKFKVGATIPAITAETILPFSDIDSISSSQPYIAVDNTNNSFIISWTDSKDGQPEIYFSTINGFISTPTRVSSNDSYTSQNSVVSSNGSKIAFAWEDYKYFGSNGCDIFINTIDTNSSIMDSVNELIANNHESKHPVLTSDNNQNFHLVWQEEKNGIYEIYYAKMDSNGWSSPLLLTDSGKDSELPVAIASDKQNLGIHIVWLEFNNLYYLLLPELGTPGNTPSLVEVIPEDGDTNVSVSIIPTALFNKELDENSINSNSVKLLNDETNNQINGTISLSDDKKKIIFYPESRLDYNTTYRFELSPSITDTDGNPIIPLIIRFTTSNTQPTSIISGVAITNIKLYKQGNLIAFQYDLDWDTNNSISNVSIYIYNIYGRLVKKINDADFSGRTCTTLWDGINRFGEYVSNGVYIYKIVTKGSSGGKDIKKGKFLIKN